MNFQDLKKVETAQFYIDIAFRAAIRRLDIVRPGIRIRTNKIEKVRRLEHLRVTVIRDKLKNSLEKIITGFPSFDSLPEFYVELMKCTMDIQQVKKSLATVNWAVNKSSELANKTLTNINGAETQNAINTTRKAFSGRVSSVIKKINKDLAFLEKIRKEMKDFPSIKTSINSVAITGFPNVGKSTLLKKMTGAQPKVANYAFTTKNLNIGYSIISDEKVQFVDTPGTLNRYNKMNAIEKKSYLVMKYIADIIVFIFDLSETYPIEKQTELFKKIQEFDKPLIIYLSKTDIVDKEVVREFCIGCNAINTKEVLETEIDREMRNLI